jgi:hypothetical protein
LDTPFYYYHVAGIILRSNLMSPELIPAEPAADDIQFTLEQQITPPIRDWFHTVYREDGTTWQQFGKHASGYILRFHQLADFHISIDGKHIDCYPFYHVETHTIRHLLLDNVLPHTLNLRGQIVLHASAVVTDTGAIAFLAPSGTGKSTLAAAFAQHGISLLADDSVVIERRAEHFWALPSYPSIRLWSHMVDALWQSSLETEAVAHYYSKKRVALQHDRMPFQQSPAPLRKIYLLVAPQAASDERIVLTPISPRDAHIELVKHTFRMDITDKRQNAITFAFHNQLASGVPFARLTYPRQVSRLAEVVAFLLKDS